MFRFVKKIENEADYDFCNDEYLYISLCPESTTGK